MTETIDTVFNHCIDSITGIDTAAVEFSGASQILENASTTGSFDWWPWIIAVFSFSLGLVGDALIRKYLKRQSLRTMRDSIIVWYEKEDIFLQKAIASYDITARNILQNNNVQPIPAQVPLMDMGRINEFRLDELTDAFVANIGNDEEDVRIKNLYNLQKQCRFIDAAIGQIKTLYGEYISELKACMDEWNRAIVSLHTSLPMYHAKAKNKKFSNQWVNTLSRLEHDVVANEGDMDPTVWYRDFIEPVIAVLSDTSRPIHHATSYQMLYTDVNRMHEAFCKFAGIKRYGAAIANYVDTIRTSSDALNNAITFFKNAKFKSFWTIR